MNALSVDALDLASRIQFPAAVVLASLGLAVALSAGNFIKRVIGLGLMQSAALLIWAGLLPGAALAGAAAAQAAALALGLALAVRAHEAYGAAELGAADGADDAETQADADAGPSQDPSP